MAAFFLVAVSIFLIVIGILGVKCTRRHGIPHRDNNKKIDIEEPDVQVVVHNDTQSLKSDVKHEKQCDNQLTVNDVLMRKLPLELINRRQYVKALCDRFESWASGSLPEANKEEEILVGMECVHDTPTIPKFSSTKTLQTKATSNNLTSFVRQCVSNIERTAFPSTSYTSRPCFVRDSAGFNQYEVLPERTAMEQSHLPSLVIATDCGLEQIKRDEGDENRNSRQPLLHRSPLRRIASSVPALAPFAVIARKAISSQSLPPVWSPSSRVELPCSRSVYLDPEELESPALPDEPEDTPLLAQVPLRKSSNSATRLLQFQQLVPSNQARVSFAQQ